MLEKRPRKNHESERICPTPFIRGACRGACPPSSIRANLLQITGPFFPNFQFIVASSSQAPTLYKHLRIPFAPHRQLATGSLGNRRPPVSKRPAKERMYHGEGFNHRYMYGMGLYRLCVVAKDSVGSLASPHSQCEVFYPTFLGLRSFRPFAHLSHVRVRRPFCSRSFGRG